MSVFKSMPARGWSAFGGKKLFIFTLILCFSLVFSQVVLAQDATTTTDEVTAGDLGVSDPQILPDSPFYVLKDFWRNLQTAFTFNQVKKAERKLNNANERIIEAQKLVEEKGEAGQKHLDKAMEKYEKELEKIEKVVEKIKEKEKNTDRMEKFLDKLADSEMKRQRVLEKLEGKIPAEVFERIKDVRERSAEKFGNIMGKLADQDKITEKMEVLLDEDKDDVEKNLKNLEILKMIELKVPEKAREAIKRAQENALKRLKERVEESGDEDKIEDIEELIEETKKRAEDAKEELKNKIEDEREALKDSLENEREALKQRLEKEREALKDSLEDKDEEDGEDIGQ